MRKDITDKLRIIYKPFIVIAIGSILVYSFLNWLIIIKGGLSVKEDIVKFWLPLCLPFIPILIWLRPRINLLEFKNDNAYFFLQILACIAIAVPIIIAQEYLITATGKLTPLARISQLSEKPTTKYYSIDHYYIDQQHVAVRNTVTVTGKNNDNFNMLIYVAMPFFDNEADTSKSEIKYWLGKKYRQQISNDLSDEEKNEKYKVFAEQSQKEFDQTDFNKFTYLEVIGNTDDHDEFNKALKSSQLKAASKTIIFQAKEGPFSERNGDKLFWTLGSFIIGCIVYLIILVFPYFDDSKLAAFKEGTLTTNNNELKEVLDLLIPKPGFFVTPIIINLNVLMYILMVFSGLGVISFKAGDLLNWGANYGPLTTGGQWWRLVTSTFLHGGLLHLLANMYGLLFVGIFLEPLLGKMKYAMVYLITGIIASLCSIWWHDATVSVGASGAIFGLYGFFLACLLLKVFPPEFGKAFLISTLVFVGFNLLMGLRGGIDNAAHIGGLVSGFLFGLIMSGQIKSKEKNVGEYV